MGRCGWGIGVTLILAVLGASCGGTGGGPSDSGHQFVFTARGRLILAVQTVSTGTAQGCPSTGNDPRRLLLTATLLDPQGVPFRNQPITFTAEFPDATFIPGNDNTGSVLTDDSGQAIITLVAGLKVGKMRVTANAPAALNISTGITVTLTEQGFVSRGPLGIIPTSVIFVNPAPHPPGGPADFIFQATGGDPPYRFFNSNPSVGRIETAGTCGSLGQYTLTGPLPAEEDEARSDTVTVQDEEGIQAPANVQVLFVTCELTVSPEENISFDNAVGGESTQITVPDAVPPITVTQTLPTAGTVVVDNNTKTVAFTVATPPFPGTNTLLIRDSRGCIATVNVTVKVGKPVITPRENIILAPGQRQQFIITGGVAPYQITASGGTVNTTVVTQAGGSFIYTAGTATGTFFIVATDALNAVDQATVVIQVATLEVEPETLRFCGTLGGETGRIQILSGVPPFTITHTFDTAGTLTCEATGVSGDTISCSGNSIIYTVGVAAPSSFDPDSVIIRDSQGRAVTVSVHINGEDCPEIELCGNGTIEGFEQCETGGNFGGLTCETFAGPGATGTLFCNDDCTIDDSNCQVPKCGNGTVDPGEECDGAVSGTCADFCGAGSIGVLSCGVDCKIDLTGCAPCP